MRNSQFNVPEDCRALLFVELLCTLQDLQTCEVEGHIDPPHAWPRRWSGCLRARSTRKPEEEVSPRLKRYKRSMALESAGYTGAEHQYPTCHVSVVHSHIPLQDHVQFTKLALCPHHLSPNRDNP